jgi:hypothetical protein
MAWALKNAPEAVPERQIMPILYRPCEVRADLRTLQIVSFASSRPSEEVLEDLLLALKISARGSDAGLLAKRAIPPETAPLTLEAQARNLLPKIEASAADRGVICSAGLAGCRAQAQLYHHPCTEWRSAYDLPYARPRPL